jgi:hypothetical protein
MVRIDNTGAIIKEKVKDDNGGVIKIYPTISYGEEGRIAALYYNDDVSGVLMITQ